MLNLYVFTTNNCNPCKKIKEQLSSEKTLKLLSDNLIDVRMVNMSDLNDEKGLTLATKFAIRKAPTLILESEVLGLTQDVHVFNNLEDLENFLSVKSHIPTMPL